MILSIQFHNFGINESDLNLFIENLTKIKLLNEIFVDTAATTLREQASADSRRPSSTPTDAAARLVDAEPLEDLFGGASQNWANLAFAPSLRNK